MRKQVSLSLCRKRRPAVYTVCIRICSTAAINEEQVGVNIEPHYFVSTDLCQSYN